MTRSLLRNRWWIGVIILGLSGIGFSSVAQGAQSSRSPIWMQRMPGKRYVYKQVGTRSLYLWVLQPAEKYPRPRPAVVFFHGGGWVAGTPAQFIHQAEYLTSRGLVSVLVQYRLLDRKQRRKTPPLVCIQDAKSAMRWVRKHAKELGVDPNRIAAAGGSAGGHLAAAVSMLPDLDDPKDDLQISCKAQAQILFNPAVDGRFGEKYQKFSPFYNVRPDTPPTIIFHGTADRIVPVQIIREFQRKLEKAGVRCECHFYEGMPHGFFNYGRYGNRYYLLTMRATDRFLASLGWLQGPPTLPAPAPNPSARPPRSSQTSGSKTDLPSS